MSNFSTLRYVQHGASGEIQLTDAIARDAAYVPLFPLRISKTRYDCGNHDGLMDAAVASGYGQVRHVQPLTLAFSMARQARFPGSDH